MVALKGHLMAGTRVLRGNVGVFEGRFEFVGWFDGLIENVVGSDDTVDGSNESWLSFSMDGLYAGCPDGTVVRVGVADGGLDG